MNTKPDTTYVLNKQGEMWQHFRHNGQTRNKWVEMSQLPEDHQAKISILAIAISDHYISGIGIRSDDAVSWGVRYIIEN